MEISQEVTCLLCNVEGHEGNCFFPNKTNKKDRHKPFSGSCNFSHIAHFL